MAVHGTRDRGCPRKTQWDSVKQDVKSIGLTRENAQA